MMCKTGQGGGGGGGGKTTEMGKQSNWHSKFEIREQSKQHSKFSMQVQGGRKGGPRKARVEGGRLREGGCGGEGKGWGGWIEM